MKKLKEFVKKNKEEILFGWGALFTMLFAFCFVYSLAMSAMANDLVKRNNDIERLYEEQLDRGDMYEHMYESLNESIEEQGTVPKGLYLAETEGYKEEILNLNEYISRLEEQLESYNK